MTEVTLHVSVWVEMREKKVLGCRDGRHAPRERVSWNLIESKPIMRQDRHAPRERVSWNYMLFCQNHIYKCHAPRERVSWNCIIGVEVLCIARHAPRERVSWNTTAYGKTKSNTVTLHVSVWVEIVNCWFPTFQHFVTLHVSVWVEISKVGAYIYTSAKSRSTWACELKCEKFGVLNSQNESRSTWACELKWKS